MITDDKPKKPRRLWRITRGLLSLFLPVQETQWYLRSSRDVTSRNLARIRKAFPELDVTEEPPASPDWAAAVAASGQTPEALESNYLAQRRRWRLMFWLLAIPVPLFTLGPVYAGNGLTFHQFSTGLVLFSGAGVAWSKALIVTFRLWQLRNRRVSEAERGTFRHFIAETRAVRDAIRGD
ncbi:conjugal transfer protein TraX [Salmonella enterica subsp. enterica serovar Liverpool]|nr:conjugal transfer protein TraX [Salmonella enterica subsp. enterica serovar Liverpool]